jgi:membrane protease subunit HflC
VNRLYAVLGAVLLLGFLVYSSIFVVNEREQAIVLRFGEIRRVIKEPGIYFKIPTNIVDSVQFIDDRVLSFDIENIRVQVRDGRRYLVDAFVAFRIVEPAEFRENVSGSLTVAQENLRTRLDASLRRVYGQRSFEAALSAERGIMMNEVRDQLRPLAVDLGIEIVDVRIRRTDLLPEVSQQTFERMKAERLAEAAQLRAAGTERAAQIRAAADREAVVTVAEAERDADILRGEGDAQRAAVFAAAYQRDPGFFDFYRSMRAYETALDNTGTTMVLSPTSEFFRFFDGSSDPAGALSSPDEIGPRVNVPLYSGAPGTSLADPGGTMPAGGAEIPPPLEPLPPVEPVAPSGAAEPAPDAAESAPDPLAPMLQGTETPATTPPAADPVSPAPPATEPVSPAPAAPPPAGSGQ